MIWRYTIKNDKIQGLFDYSESEEPAEYPSFEVALLALGSVRGLGVKSIGKIVDAYGDKLGLIFHDKYENIIERIPSMDLKLHELLTYEIRKDPERIVNLAQKELDNLLKDNIHIIPFSRIPKQMAGYSDSPRWLFVQGDVGTVYSGCLIGAVGTRQPSEEGRRRARLAARILGGYEVAVVSGLAEGIDDEIHRASLERGLKNVAFLGHGINKVFPASTESTREWILNSGGAVVSEYFPNEGFQKSYFVQRNRLQALLSSAVIFIEANQKSGTAYTLEFAHKYRRRIAGFKAKEPGIEQTISLYGYPIFNIISQSGIREFDRFIRSTVGGTNNRNKLIKKITEELGREISIRDLSRSDVQQIIAELIAIAHLASNKE
ncbi:hypothetical protein F8S09_16400 [Deinococcus sp. SDU3-2]|uniref:Smf/DprA SLOG domain-containing protein n=1 Tax=Deinococcus terrestris TaxID=2651870 RepID=A0A7X1NYV2_9DEIO|nr:DNA-processing protein DprA [Deinococcus terrestris]MPY68238.1 hypothetical protein [Deinococcus terrestris]